MADKAGPVDNLDKRQQDAKKQGTVVTTNPRGQEDSVADARNERN